MGVSTKGFLASPIKDVFLIGALIHRVLDQLMLDVKRLEYPKTPLHQIPEGWFSESASRSYAHASLKLEASSDAVYVHTRIRGYNRKMALYFTCDVDNQGIALESISLSLGCSGFSDILMQASLYALSLLGPVYYQTNDSIDEPPVLLPEAPLSYKAAMTKGHITPYQFEKWVTRFVERGVLFGIPRKVEDFEAIFGIAKDTYESVQEITDSGKRWDELKRAMHCDVPLPSFWPTQLSDMGDTNPEVAKANAESVGQAT